jgi:hypothetical protein
MQPTFGPPFFFWAKRLLHHAQKTIFNSLLTWSSRDFVLCSRGVVLNVIPCAFPNETFSILCLHCPQGTLFYILHAWSLKSSLGLCHMFLTRDSHRSHASLSCSWWPHIFSFHIPCQSPTLLLTYIHGPNGQAMWISFWESHSKVWKHSFIDRPKCWNSCLSELDSSSPF